MDSAAPGRSAHLLRADHVAIALVVSATFTLLLAPIYSLDTPWHLAAGDWMLEHRELLDRDTFSYSFAGAPWQNHAPAFQLLLALFVAAFGLAGATLLPALTGATLAGFCAATAASTRRERALSALLVLAAFGASREHLSARPHLLGFLFSALSAYAILRVARRPSSRWGWALPAIAVAWIFVHASHVLIVPMVLFALVVAAARRDWPVARRIGLAGLAVVVLEVVLAWSAFARFFAHVESPFLREYIGEWSPTTAAILFGSGIGRVWLAIAALSVVGASMRLARGPRDTRLWVETGLLAILVIATFSASRALPLFLCGFAPVWLPSAMAPLGWLIERAPPVRSTLASIAWLATMATIFLVSLAGSRLGPLGFGFDERRFPIAAVDRLAQLDREGHTFNAYNFGGYLIWRGVPRDGVLVDGRAATLYPDEFLLRFARSYDDPATFDGFVREYDITEVLIPRHSQRTDAFKQRLLRDPRWLLAYSDSVAVLFLRRAPE